MIPIVPIVVSVATFSVAAWGVNKVVEKVTGRTIEGNLDAASDKVIEFAQRAKDSAKS